jgi:hypothetical protein
MTADAQHIDDAGIGVGDGHPRRWDFQAGCIDWKPVAVTDPFRSRSERS